MDSNYFRTHKTKKVPKSKFKPTREFCQDAMEEYFKKGGKVTKTFILPSDNVVANPQDLLLDE